MEISISYAAECHENCWIVAPMVMMVLIPMPCLTSVIFECLMLP